MDESRFTELVLAAASRLDLVDQFGRLLPLDSIAYVDLALELEQSARVRIPSASLTPDNFQSLEAISTLLSSLQA